MVEILIMNDQTLSPVAIPIFTEYFHAVSLSDKDTNIFNTSVGSFELTPYPNFEPYDVVEKILKPLENKPVNPVLKRLNNNPLVPTELLVPLEGLLVLPDAAEFPGKRPMVLIGHGMAAGYVGIDDKAIPPKKSPEGVVITKGKFVITVLEKQTPSFVGYHYRLDTERKIKPERGLQKTLAAEGIASYSINLNIVNALDNNEQDPFEKMALDFNQRILLFFLHLKLLRIIAGETVTGGEFPIRFFEGSGFKNLQDALQSTTHTGLIQLRDASQGKVDFTKLGFMGHSRGADAVSRVPAYFFNGATLPNPTFPPTNPEVNRRIRILSEQIGQPQQEHIKCILALEPTATINKEEPHKHGYVIDNKQTMYFVVVGTHDEDVSMDPVRIYEFPECPKVMIAINGATHKRFNSIWALSLESEKVRRDQLRELATSALTLPQHEKLLNNVAGSCFTGTLGGNPSYLLPFTKKTDFVIELPNSVDFQSAWKFGFPFPANTPVNLKVTSMSEENIKGRGYDFEQELTAFFVEKNNEGTVTIRVPIDPNKLSNFTHFSFRFAKGFDVRSDPTRVEEKNFTIQFFENDTPVGKPIAGGGIKTLELRAFRAFDEINELDEGPEKDIEYSILLQTAEITLEHLSSTELARITRIDINVIPEDTTPPPNPSTARVVRGTIGGALLGGAVGVGGALLFAEAYNVINDPDLAEGERKKILIGSGLVGTAAGGVGAFRYFRKPGEFAYVFKDFLLTNRQIP